MTKINGIDPRRCMRESIRSVLELGGSRSPPPDGASFTVDGDQVSRAGWTFRIGCDAREGLTLHQLAVDGWSVVHRASMSMIVVLYANTSPVRYWLRP